MKRIFTTLSQKGNDPTLSHPEALEGSKGDLRFVTVFDGAQTDNLYRQ